MGQFTQGSWPEAEQQGSPEASVQQPCQGVSSEPPHSECLVKPRPPSVGASRERRGLLAGELLMCEEF